MYRLILIAFFLFYSQSIWSQNISVASFKILPTDLDARVNYPIKDQNGDACAIIKVVTTENGLEWEGDQLGITKVVPKTAQYWLYVPYGAKRLTISHGRLGLYKYAYPLSIEKATVYELILATGKVTTTVTPLSPIWLTIRSNPEGADVYINDVLKGVTPMPVKLLPGKYTYRIDKPMYNRYAGIIEINAQEKDGKKDLSVDLKPAFGTLKISTLPEVGALVLIDDIETGKTTPFIGDRIKSGTHIITLKKETFQPKSLEIKINDGITAEKVVTLLSNVANVKVTTQPEADIYIDNNFVAKGIYQGKVSAGVTTFEARKQGYYSDKKDLEITAGQGVTVDLTVQPILGSIDIVSNPMDAKIFINEEEKGITPLSLQNQLIGQYSLRLEKKGYSTKKLTYTIEENKTTEISEVLAKDQKVNNSSIAKNAEEKKNDLPRMPTVLPNYSTDFYKYKRGKTAWLVSGLISSGIGAFAFVQAKKNYNDYQTTTAVADDFRQKATLYNTISPIAFGIAGLCAIEVIIKSSKQSKAKNQTIGFYPKSLDNHMALGLVYKF